MEAILSAFAMSLTPQTVFAMLGGLLGALIASDRKRYGWQLSFMFILASVAACASLGEYLYKVKDVASIWLIFVVNIPLGMTIGALLDVLRIANPKFIDKLVNTVGDSTIAIVGDSILDKVEGIFGVKRKEIDSSPEDDKERQE